MGRKKKGNGQAKAYDDTLSEVSDMMSMSSYQTNRSDGESDPDIIDDDESKFKMFIDDVGNKNSKKSAPAIKFIKSKMQGHPMTSLLSGQKETLSTELYRALRKAKGETRLEILKCLAILFISIDEDDAGVIFDDVQRELIVALLDGTKDVAATLAIVTAAIGNPEDVAKTTQCFRNIIKMAFLKGDGSIPALKASQAVIVIECLEAWSFLLSSVSRVRGFGRFIADEIDSVIDDLPGIFSQPNVDLRIAAGELLAVIYEMSRDFRGDEWEGFDIEEDLLEALNDLAQGVAVGGGSVKATSKKERKEQRCSFKQLRDFIQDSNPPQPRILHITRQETLEISSFTDLARYEMLCWCLDSGINNHLTFNELLRSDVWFGLGHVLPQLTSLDKNDKVTKLEQKVRRGQLGKARSAHIKKGRRNAGDDHYSD